MLFQSKNISALSEHEAVQTCPLSSDQGNTKMLLQSEPLQGTDVVCSGPGSLSPDFFSHGGISSPGIVESPSQHIHVRMCGKGGWGKAALDVCDFLPRLMVGPIHILSDDTVSNSANLLRKAS